MRHGNMRLSLGAQSPRSAGGEGCCRRADTVGKTHAADGRMPQDRARIRTAHCSLAAALTVIGLRHRPQSPTPPHDRARLPQTCAIMGGWGRRPQCEVHLRYLAPLAFRAQGLANAESWQDLHVVHDSRGLCSEKGPFLARYSRGVSSNGDLQGFSDAWRAYLAKASSFRMRGGDILPRRGPFPVRGLFGIHRGKILPSSDTQERITSTYRHRQALGNAFRGHLAVAERPRAHCEHTLLCAGLRGIQFAGICRHARPPDDAPRQHIVSKATLRLRKGQHARSHRTPPEPIREMRRCPAAAVGTAAMKELGHRRAAYWGGREGH